MKILLIFTLCLISDGGASKEVTGYSGGGVLIKCKYDTEYRQNTKYFCKGSWPGCSDQIKTEVKNQWVNSGRFSLYDDTKSAEFWVMIRELTVQDTGTYQCGVDIKSWTDIYTTVELNVKEDLSNEKSINMTVHVGGDLTVSCKYPESLRSNPKFLCKQNQNGACSYKEESKKNVTMGKFSLYDDRAIQTFSVIIRDVTEQDSGEYWCGAEAAWTSDHGYKVYFTRINLTVTGFPASTVITVSVILLLFLIGIIILIVIVQKKHKMQGGASSIGRRSVHESQNDQVVPLDACEYEEIKYTRRLSASDAGTFTVYSTAELPTIPSDHHTVYANSDLPTRPCGPLQTVYGNVALHTRDSCESNYSTPQLPPNPPDQDVYSSSLTAQIYTNLSDSSVG
ncbi:polymeric immunoglobulin receptor-like isoform X2 [Hemibagrus wyckioides]|uniref:polymeric immunoglobulin receptor-like isoform X2 n=1 Tax=Hemibagrus wyckioides TaxID=337641 RepID=UPI00266CAB8B|nr:polymeric immunoglobulin receptor-like isoform X2 [Hemibagrus wyckioides]